MKVSEFYALYAKQIILFMKNKSSGWQNGFRSGLIATLNDPSKKKPFRLQITLDYDNGYLEGRAYALYKLSRHKTKQKSDVDVIVGFVVQDYDFSFEAIQNTALGERNRKLVNMMYPKQHNDNKEVIDQLSKERQKINSMMWYLKD